MNALKESLARFIAFHLPKSVAYWCMIRVHAYATCGKYSNKSPDEVGVMESLKHWREAHERP